MPFQRPVQMFFGDPEHDPQHLIAQMAQALWINSA